MLCFYFVYILYKTTKYSDDIILCPQCEKTDLNVNRYYELGTLYGNIKVYEVKIHILFCVECGYKQQYDGTNQKVFNVNNKSLFLHPMLNAVTHSTVAAATSMNAIILGFQRM